MSTDTTSQTPVVPEATGPTKGTIEWEDPHLKSLEHCEGVAPYDADNRTLDLLRATLRFPAPTQLKGEKLAQDMVFMAEGTVASAGEAPNTDLANVEWDIYNIILDIVRLSPPRHPWHDALIEALKVLAQREGPMVSNLHPVSFSSAAIRFHAESHLLTCPTSKLGCRPLERF